MARFSQSLGRRFAQAAATRVGRWITLLVVLALLLFSGIRRSATTVTSTCRLTLPRVVSHRGVDEDEHGPAPSTLPKIGALIDDGIGSFDLDLFWADDGGGTTLFIGHPPSLRKMWKLADEVHATPLDTLRTRAQPDGLLRFTDLLALLARRRADVGTVSLELKFPTHPEWMRRLRMMYAQAAAHGVAQLIAGIVSSRAEAVAHRAAQAAAGVRVPLLCILRDIDAPVGADGEPHPNASMMRASADAFDGWAPSWKLLEPSLLTAAQSAPLSVWSVDTEAQLRRVFTHGPKDVISNRPRWARKTLAAWQRDVCAGVPDTPDK